MVTKKSVKHPYLKLSFDVLGILSFIGVLLIVSLNFYISTDEGFTTGVEVAGADMIVMNFLVLTTIISAFASFLLKKMNS